MAVRLPVVMIQTPPPTAAAQALSEGVLGELIGRPGIDMTLVGGLDQMEDSTDRLTIESLVGDVAVLDWQPVEAIVRAVRSAGIDGCRWPHPGDPDAPRPEAPGRRIYAFDLNAFGSAEAVCEAVKTLLASRQTKTFTLQLPPASHSRPEPAPRAAAQDDRPPAQPKGDAAGRVSAAAAPENGSSLPGEDPSPSPQHARKRLPAAAVDLDRLVDQLDELDP